MYSVWKDPWAWSLIGFMLFIVASCSFGIHGANKNQNKFELECAQKGGQVIVLRRDSLCTSPDGRIIGDL